MSNENISNRTHWWYNNLLAINEVGLVLVDRLNLSLLFILIFNIPHTNLNWFCNYCISWRHKFACCIIKRKHFYVHNTSKFILSTRLLHVHLLNNLCRLGLIFHKLICSYKKWRIDLVCLIQRKSLLNLFHYVLVVSIKCKPLRHTWHWGVKTKLWTSCHKSNSVNLKRVIAAEVCVY